MTTFLERNFRRLDFHFFQESIFADDNDKIRHFKNLLFKKNKSTF